MHACNSLVPAADAKKVGGASDDTRRMPSPPLLTGNWPAVAERLIIIIIVIKFIKKQ
jgi:hypothetical protein